jgi:hypothetical protein
VFGFGWLVGCVVGLVFRFSSGSVTVVIISGTVRIDAFDSKILLRSDV